MGFTLVTVTSGTNDPIKIPSTGLPAGQTLIQRSDGVIVNYYTVGSGADPNRIMGSYSYDLGLTWTQNTTDIPWQEPTGTLFIELNKAVHFVVAGTHVKFLPCQPFTTLANLGTGNFPHDFIVQDNNNVHCIYVNTTTSRSISYTQWDGESWGNTVLIDSSHSDTWGSSRMCREPNGDLHIIAEDANQTLERNDSNIYYYNRISGSWSTKITVDITAGDSENPHILFTTNGSVHITYHKTLIGGFSPVQSEIYYGIKASADTVFNLTLLTVQTASLYSNNPVISKDTANNLYICYEANTTAAQSIYNIYMLKSSDGGSTWETAVNVTNSTTTDLSYRLIFTFKEERYYPGYNILASGVAGMFYNNIDKQVSYFYSDDVAYPFAITTSPQYCSLPINFYSVPGAAPVDFYSRPDTQH